MSDITAIILTKNEAIHIERVVHNLLGFVKRIIVVDSESTDNTRQLASIAGAEVIVHPWPGNQAAQFNWALDNLEITTDWILRLDADEWLSDDLKAEIGLKLPSLTDEISAVEFKRGRYFMGKRLKHGIVNGVFITRLFRKGKARYEQRIMDEHLKISDGKIVRFKHKFFDDNRLPLSAFIAKHDNYALREAALMLDSEFGLSEHKPDESQNHLASGANNKRRQKGMYARLPMFWRAWAYFAYRYFIRLGFLDGKEGFMWDFMQGYWYRSLVDGKLLEIKKLTDNNPEKIKVYLKDHGITF